MTVHVTREDIYRAGRSGGDNPVSRALLRATSRAWVVFGGNMAYSRSSPHQALALPFEVSQAWRLWLWEPFEFEVQWAQSSPQSRDRRDQRQWQRRTHPRFGHDRRARDRRYASRRTTDRRGSFAHSSFERRIQPRSDPDSIAHVISAETSGGETTVVETNGQAN